jgi:hypothetical protein
MNFRSKLAASAVLAPLGLLALLFGSCSQFIADPLDPDDNPAKNARLSGTLMDAWGSPAVGAWVRLYAVDSSAAPDSVQATAGGAFAFSRLADGNYALYATLRKEGADMALFRTGIAVAGQTDFGTDTLRLVGSVSVQVRSEGQPVQGARCFVEGTPWEAVTNASGTCVLQGVPPGTVQVHVSHPTLGDTVTGTIHVLPDTPTPGGTINIGGTNPGPVDTIPQGNLGPDTVGSAYLIAHWNFEEASGTVLHDRTGKGHDGTVVGTAAWVTDGVSGKSLHLNGSTHVEIPATTAFSSLRNFTVSAWSWQDTQDNPLPLLEFSRPGFKSGLHMWTWVLGTSNAPQKGAVYANLRPDNQDYVITSAAGLAPVGQWNHTVITHDSATRISRLYVNGVQRGALTLSPGQTPSLDGLLYLGFRSNQTLDADGRYGQGRLDEVRLYGTTLTAAQILASYNALAPAPPPPGPDRYFPVTTSTLGLWTFNSREGTTFADSSPHTRHLTATNATAVTLAASPNGQAATFNGARASLSSDALTLAGNNLLTYEARIFMSAYPPQSQFNSTAAVAGSYAGLMMYVTSSGKLEVGCQTGNGSTWNWWSGETVSGAVPLNTWVTIAVAADKANNKIYGYVNGVPVQLYTAALAPAGNVLRGLSTYPFAVGNSSQDPNPFPGRIDEVRVSNGLLLGVGLNIIADPVETGTP